MDWIIHFCFKLLLLVLWDIFFFVFHSLNVSFSIVLFATTIQTTIAESISISMHIHSTDPYVSYLLFAFTHFILCFRIESTFFCISVCFCCCCWFFFRECVSIHAVFANGFFCIVKRIAEASLEVMTSFMHFDNNYYYFNRKPNCIC